MACKIFITPHNFCASLVSIASKSQEHRMYKLLLVQIWGTTEKLLSPNVCLLPAALPTRSERKDLAFLIETVAFSRCYCTCSTEGVRFKPISLICRETRPLFLFEIAWFDLIETKSLLIHLLKVLTACITQGKSSHCSQLPHEAQWEFLQGLAGVNPPCP